MHEPNNQPPRQSGRTTQLSSADDGIDLPQVYTTLVNAYARTVKERLKRGKRSRKGEHDESVS
jgi:hypothetical protein